MRRRYRLLAAASMLPAACSPSAAWRGRSDRSASPTQAGPAGSDATVARLPATTSTEPAPSLAGAAPDAERAPAGPTVTFTAPGSTTTTTLVTLLPERAEDSYSDVEWAIRATFPETPDRAVGIARCESGLDPEAVSPGGTNVGLMQLNVVHKGLAASMGYAWPQMLQVLPNLAVARAVYDAAGGWEPWSCR